MSPGPRRNSLKKKTSGKKSRGTVPLSPLPIPFHIGSAMNWMNGGRSKTAHANWSPSRQLAAVFSYCNMHIFKSFFLIVIAVVAGKYIHSILFYYILIVVPWFIPMVPCLTLLPMGGGRLAPLCFRGK